MAKIVSREVLRLMEEEKAMAKKMRKIPKESKKKQRATPSPTPESQESKWQEFLRRHSATKEEKK
jgi:hypothetical protein